MSKMKRRILIGIDETATPHESCKFVAHNCLKIASTKNAYGVPMCEHCFTIWNKLRDRHDGRVRYAEMISLRRNALNPKPNTEEKESSEDEPTDEFYCGEY